MASFPTREFPMRCYSLKANRSTLPFKRPCHPGTANVDHSPRSHGEANATEGVMQQRLAVARELARQTIEKRGEVATIEAIEREAAIIAKGLYIERRSDEVALTERAIAEQANGGQR